MTAAGFGSTVNRTGRGMCGHDTGRQAICLRQTVSVRRTGNELPE